VKTAPATLPSPPPAADMLVSDEVIFRHVGPDGREAQVHAPIAVGLLYAANALRADEPFALGYPGDSIGWLARLDNEGRVAVANDLVATVEGMARFLDSYADAIAAQFEPIPAQEGGGADPEPDGPAVSGGQVGNLSAPDV